jgi:hypothetical protein
MKDIVLINCTTVQHVGKARLVPVFVGTVNAAKWEVRLCPKSLSIFRLQIIDSTHSIFVNFVAQNHMFVGNEYVPYVT